MEFSTDIFRLFDEKWALVTAGDKTDFNTMTISWGSLGSLWGSPGKAKPIATIYIRPCRHTFKFLEEQDRFTISFFDEAYRKDLAVLGAKSGKDCDKLALTGLTPRFLENAVTFNEANCTMVCRKIYSQDMDPDRFLPEIKEEFYPDAPGGEPHRYYIGEVEAIL